MKISTLLGMSSAYCMLFTFCMMPIIWLVVGLYFDKKYKGIYNPVARLSILSGLARAIQYSRLIVFGKHFQNKYWRVVFGNYDLKKEARVIDKIVAYPFVISLILACGLGIVSFPLKWLGY